MDSEEICNRVEYIYTTMDWKGLGTRSTQHRILDYWGSCSDYGPYENLFARKEQSDGQMDGT